MIGLGHDIKMVSHFMLSKLIFVSGDGAKEKGGGIWNLSKHGCVHFGSYKHKALSVIEVSIGHK
jgi:hypothetical protein